MEEPGLAEGEEEGVVEVDVLGAVEDFVGPVEEVDGLVDVAVAAVGLDEGGQGGGGEGETVVLGHLGDEGPHGLVVVGAGEDADDLFELDGGGDVDGVVVVGPGPVEEADALRRGGGARAEDAEDQLRRDGDAELVEGALHVEVAADDVGHVLDRREVLIFSAAR